MKKLLLLPFSILLIACSKDDSDEKKTNCDCDKVEYNYMITVENNNETWNMEQPPVDESQFIRGESEFYGVDCSEDGDVIDYEEIKDRLPQQIHFFYSKTVIECN